MAEVDRFEAGQASEAASLEVGQPVVAEVELFEADDVDEAVLLKLLDRVPAQVQLLQGLDGRHGAAGDRGVRNPVASQAHFPQFLVMAISSVQFPFTARNLPLCLKQETSGGLQGHVIATILYFFVVLACH